MLKLQILLILVVGLASGLQVESTFPPAPTTLPSASCSDTVCMVQQFAQQLLLVLQQIYETMGSTIQQYTLSSP